MELKDLEDRLSRMVSNTEPPGLEDETCAPYLKACDMLLKILLARSKVKEQDPTKGARHSAVQAVLNRHAQ